MVTKQAAKRTPKKRSPEQVERFDAFKLMALELSGEMKKPEPERNERMKHLAKRAQEVPGLGRFSLPNQFLIMMQRPGAVEAHTFNGWKEQGKMVRKGEKGIYIRAPRVYGDEADSEEKSVTFRTISVFDQDQVMDAADFPAAIPVVYTGQGPNPL